MVDNDKDLKLLQGYIWYPRGEDINLGDYLPEKLEPGIHILWDEITPPFTFFDDGTLAASQHFFQFTAIKLGDSEQEAKSIIPWLAETLQQNLNQSPESVGWQIFEDLRDIFPRHGET